MRWWLNTDNKAFSYENALVLAQMDFSSLPTDIWMVQWIDGKGEIEYQDAEGNNLNGLRENFIDLTPWIPFFQQFMTFLPGITLEQAQKIQIELIAELYENKRQLPFHFAVTAGDFSWEATDAALTAMSAATIPALLANFWNGTTSFTPVGQGTPVALTVFDMSDIMAGIMSRRASLETTKFNKTAEVNALTSISAVIAYDVTTGW
jgi:hypothetical protein